MAIDRERIVPVHIEEEMRNSYLDYSMSVIVSRALPDVRDGLKPVHRRILTAMNDLNLAHNRPYRKSAKVSGDVNGNYHPHGTAAIYETMVRMAQDFSLRYPLIDGQGNFGSVDGDPPAAERYTEVRMGAFAEEMLADIDKETVEFGPNYDGSRMMPLVLPGKVPNLLVNGASGIAVGMATNIPPHNIGEIVDGAVALLENPDLPDGALFEHVKGPDFPTAGIVLGRVGIQQAYTTGKGRVIVRARTSMEELKNERQAIIVSELPYQINKAALIERIAELVKSGHIEGIADIRDESDREGMRVVIILKKDADPRVVENQLFKHTQMQITFGIIMLALVNNRPQVLSLKQLVTHFLEHREDVVVKRTRFDLRKAEERAHILEGFRIALDHIDEIIALIKSSETPEIAKQGLMAEFDLTDIQAQAILDMRLQRLTGLERRKIEDEYQELVGRIAELKAILGDRSLVLEIIKDELLEMKEAYGDDRRTEILDKGIVEFEAEDLIAEEDMAITISHNGYIKRLALDSYRQQRRGGRGVTGIKVRDEDFVEHLFIASTHSYILFFTDRGKCHWLKVHAIPIAGRQARGKAIVNLLGLSEGERITGLVPVSEFSEDQFLLTATKWGMIKKTNLSLYSRPRRGGIVAMTIKDEDTLIDAAITRGDQDIVLAKRNGRAIRFNEREVRTMGRTAGGVRGIQVDKSDEVIGMVVVQNGATLLTVTENGFGKRSHIEDYPTKHRGGKGVINIKTTQRNGKVVAIKEVRDQDQLMIITRQGIVIRCPISQLSVIGRNTQGVRLINIEEGDVVVDVAHLAREDEE
ncbi:MAG: DNA gyrase subunit A [Candidatus Latescibacteria bacterium]|nr:DNA gyrase subunit A [Candidatus Latescibacterota bacterium]NIM22668.1 DNA gyrase subunit A [Candidatus Latescibacterota bacterium]NIM64957.1 DNA gyrase subunit A [Candidatus Latescibacterota bacterium]NIO01472.1 DNA gyrase subunit A [Candidatus Latescibacterota bacterium]NIO27982.1 DNA gyrase subunit A [Candidatus Latescibacterota bacterium]